MVKNDQFATKAAMAGSTSGSPANPASRSTGTDALCQKDVNNPNPSAVHIQVTYSMKVTTTANSSNSASGDTSATLQILRVNGAQTKVVWSVSIAAAVDSEHLLVTKAKAPADQYVHFIDFDPPSGVSTYKAQLKWAATKVPPGGKHAYSANIGVKFLGWKR